MDGVRSHAATKEESSQQSELKGLTNVANVEADGLDWCKKRCGIDRRLDHQPCFACKEGRQQASVACCETGAVLRSFCESD